MKITDYPKGDLSETEELCVKWARENRQKMNNMSREEKDKYLKLAKKIINGEIILTADGSMIELSNVKN